MLATTHCHAGLGDGHLHSATLAWGDGHLHSATVAWVTVTCPLPRWPTGTVICNATEALWGHSGYHIPSGAWQSALGFLTSFRPGRLGGSTEHRTAQALGSLGPPREP